MSHTSAYKVGGSFVIDSFNDFYEQIIGFKNHVISGSWQDLAPDGLPQNGDVVAEYIISRLQSLLEQQAVQAAYGGETFAQSYYAEAQYIMAAFADEIFLSMEWEGKKYWESHILEQRLFNTHSSGQVFFERLENLLQVRNPEKSETALVYLYALGLGFRGKYRGRDEGELISSYMERLYTFVNRRDPFLFKTDEPLFPEAENNILKANAPKDLPNAGLWYMIFLLIGLVYLLISYLIWYTATSDISEVVDRILQNSFISQ